MSKLLRRVRELKGKVLYGATPFEMFFADCIIICAEEYIGPDDYLWDLKAPGIWLDKYNDGLTPREAVMSVFKGVEHLSEGK